MVDPRRAYPQAKKKRHDLQFGATHAGGAITRYLNSMNHRAPSIVADTDVQTRTPICRGGKMKCRAMHVLMSVAPGAADSATLTLRVNGAPSLLTCIVTGAGIVEASVTAEVELIDTDVIDIDCTTTAGAGASTVDVTIMADETG